MQNDRDWDDMVANSRTVAKNRVWRVEAVSVDYNLLLDAKAWVLLVGIEDPNDEYSLPTDPVVLHMRYHGDRGGWMVEQGRTSMFTETLDDQRLGNSVPVPGE